MLYFEGCSKNDPGDDFFDFWSIFPTPLGSLEDYIYHKKILWHYDTTKSYANANSENLAREYNQGKAKNNDLTGKDTLILTSSLIIVCSFSSISKGKGSIILQNIPSLMKHICLVKIIFRKVKVWIRAELKRPLLNLYLFHNFILCMLKLICKVLPLPTKSATWCFNLTELLMLLI